MIKDVVSAVRPKALPSLRGLTVVVPFYKNPQLVRPLFESLLRSQAELGELGARLVFYNDSPGDTDLQAELARALDDREGLNLSMVENSANLGFVGTCNAAFEGIIADGGDIILLNSDAVVFPGVFRELVEVAYGDPMIGFVCPRSNNATIATLPHGAERLNLTPDEHYRRFLALSAHLPRMVYAPVAVGFCLFIKGRILRDLGGFDPAYGKGYNEENDLICRANRFGYRAALANHAFAWHQGEQSFDTTGVGKAERNARLLYKRYPEYLPLIGAYFRSPHYMTERVLAGLAPSGGYRLLIGFDFSNFGMHHNGTFEAGRRLLAAAVQDWPDDVGIVVLCSREAFEFHGLEASGRVRWCDTHDPDILLAAIVRVGQVYDKDSMARLCIRAPVVAVFMQDTISADCGYLSIDFDGNLWSFTMKQADLVFGVSQFTVDQLRRRYPIGDRTVLRPILWSVAPCEYAPERTDQFADHDELDSPRRLLVIGNHFKHKGLDLAVAALAKALPDTRIVALGLKKCDFKNVECVDSGYLSAAEVDELYRQADAVVFPTHYEGFGFPVMHALARSRPIYVRRLPVFEEIAASLTEGRDNIRWFDDHQQLVAMMRESFSGWRGGPAVGEIGGWRRCAGDVYDGLQDSIPTVSYAFLHDRFQLLNTIMAADAMDGQTTEARLAQMASQQIRRLFLAILNIRFIYLGLRMAWRALRAARRQTRA